MGVLAIDGPAGSGKSTVARALARRLGLAYLDTGAMYRAVTAAALRAGLDPADTTTGAAIATLAERCRLDLSDTTVAIDGVDVSAEIRQGPVTAAVSAVAANPAVRTALVDQQRAWIAKHRGGVLEGRDIGTVVAPDATLKVYLTASPQARSLRRVAEGTVGPDHAAVAADLARRDQLDSTRETAPLTNAVDAVTVDTTELGVEQVVDVIAGLWKDRCGTNPGETQP